MDIIPVVNTNLHLFSFLILPGVIPVTHPFVRPTLFECLYVYWFIIILIIYFMMKMTGYFFQNCMYTVTNSAEWLSFAY